LSQYPIALAQDLHRSRQWSSAEEACKEEQPCRHGRNSSTPTTMMGDARLSISALKVIHMPDRNQRSNKLMPLAIWLFVSFHAGAPAPTAAQEPTPDGGTPPFEVMGPKSPQQAVEKTFGSLIRLNAKTAQAFSLARAAVKLDPFAVVDALIDLLSEDGSTPDITVQQARKEIIGAIREKRALKS
jgi:hypothetical protein